MDRLEKYRKIVCECLEGFCEYDKNAQMVFDYERDRYLVIHNEWREYDRIYGCTVHIDIIDSQIWIQQNNTEIYINRELIKKGVAPEDVILGFRAPSIRKLISAASAKQASSASSVS